jgi:hypothetical protein
MKDWQRADARAETNPLGQPGGLADEEVRARHEPRPGGAEVLGDPGLREAETVRLDDLLEVFIPRVCRDLEVSLVMRDDTELHRTTSRCRLA